MTNLIDLIHDFAETRHKHGAPEYNAKSRAALDAVRAELHRRAEPVGSVYTVEAIVPGGGVKHHVTLHKPLPAGTLLYAAPPNREALTDEQIFESLPPAPEPTTRVVPRDSEPYPLWSARKMINFAVEAVKRSHGIGAKDAE